MAESITLQTSDNNVQQSDVLGRLSFAASNESSGSDARLIAASIYAVAETDFTEISNATSLIFATASSESAGEVMRITSVGDVGIGTSFPSSKLEIVGDGGTGDSGILTISDPNGGTTTSWIKLYADDGFDDLTWHISYSDTTIFKALEFRTAFNNVPEVTIEPSGEFWVLSDKSVYTYRYLSDKTRFNTSSQPAYSWSMDDDTGMFSPTGNAIAFSTGGTERMRIDSNQVVVNSGNIIFNEIGGNFDFRVEGDSDENLLFVDASTDRIGIGTNTPIGKLNIENGDFIFNSASGNHFFVAGGSGNPNLFVVNGIANQVGIGGSTLVPGFMLNVNGSFRSATAVIGTGSIPLPSRPIEILNHTNIDELSIRLRSDRFGNYISGYTFPTSDGLSGQTLLTNGSGVVSWSSAVLGTGISNYVPKWINSTTLTSGLIYDDGNHIGIGNNPNGHLDSFSTYGPSLVLGNGSGDVGQFFYSTNNASIWFTNGTELNNLRGQITYLHSEDKLAFGTSGVGISMALDANGNLGIGQNYPSARLNVEGGNIVFNDLGGNFDFRVEGDSAQYLLFTDASSDSIGIGTSAPAANLHIARPTNATYGNIFIEDTTAMNINVGGSIILGGRHTTAGATARFGGIRGLKANNTDGDFGSVLSLLYNNGTSLTEGFRITPQGNIGIGGIAPAISHKFSIRGNLDANNAIGLLVHPAYGSAATSGNLYNYYSWGALDGYTLQNYYHYFTAAPALANGAIINNELCYTANNSTGVLSQRGFYSTINGESSWQLHMAGTARSFINGNLGIGNSNPTSKLSVENGSVVFNSSAGNHDFTVGGDTDVHTLCVDASADSVGIGIATPLSTLHIEKNTIPSIRIQRSAGVGTASVPAERGHILFSNYNNTYDHIKLISWGRESNFLAGMLGVNISNSAGVSSEVLTIDNQSTAATFGLRTYNIPLVTTSGNVIFNETAGNFDFRAEGLSDPNLLFVDASSDRVGIGTSSPTHKLHVAGSGYMDWTQLQSNYYINYPIPGSIAGNSNRDQIILFAPTGVATLFRGYIDSNSTATSNEYLRNFSRTFIHYRTSADANTVPQVTVNGVYNGNQSDLAANDNGRVVKVLHSGVEYWGLIMQDLAAFQNPGAPVFNGYASSLTNFQYGHRDGFTTVTDITPNTTAGRSASIFRYQNLSVPDGNVGIGTNNPSVRLDVEGGDIVFNDLGGNFDFRVEGDADANLLFVDASNDSVNIGTGSSTGSKLYVATNNATNYSSILASGAAGSQSSWVRISNFNNSINDSFAGLFTSVKQPSTGVDQGAFISCLSSTEHVYSPHIVFGSRSGGSTFQELMRISSSGNLGIGTNVPSSKLHVVGSTSLIGPIIEGYNNAGNTGTAQTIALTNGTIQNYTLTGNCTFTMPTATAGQSFTVMLRTGAGSFTSTFTNVKWPNNTAPTITTTASRMDLITFVSDGTHWYGTASQNYTV